MFKSLLAKLKASLTTIWSYLKVTLGQIWDSVRTPLILAAIVYTIIRFRDIIIDLVIGNAKKLFKSTQTKNAMLQTQENADSQQADTLIKQVQELQTQETSVKDDWYKDSKNE